MINRHRCLKLSEALNFIAEIGTRNWCFTAKIGIRNWYFSAIFICF